MIITPDTTIGELRSLLAAEQVQLRLTGAHERTWRLEAIFWAPHGGRPSRRAAFSAPDVVDVFAALARYCDAPEDAR